MLVRKGLAPSLNKCHTRLIGGRSALPKGGSVELGTGWVQKSSRNYTFNVPPGGNTDVMQFVGLVVGDSYRITFVASASAGYGGMVFRPGTLLQDTAISADGGYSFDFVARDDNGLPRFDPNDVTGVTQIGISGIKLVAL